MGTQTVQSLPAVTVPADSDVLYAIQSSVDKKETLGQIREYIRTNLGNGIVITDPNTITQSGFYIRDGGTTGNFPYDGKWGIYHIQYDADNAVQIALNLQDGSGSRHDGEFIRNKVGGTWYSWRGNVHVPVDGLNGFVAQYGNYLGYKRVLTGTLNQINVSFGDGASGNPTFSTPQDINTSSSPTFLGMKISTFTAGSIPFVGADGFFSQNNSKLFWDNTNYFLGVGLSAPFSRLSVAGYGSSYGIGFEASVDPAGRRWWIANDQLSYGDFAIMTEATKGNSAPSLRYFYMLGTGFLGLGNIIPTSRLHIYGTATTPSLTVNNQIFTVNASNGVELAIGGDVASPYGLWIQTRNQNNSSGPYPISLNPLGGNVGIGTLNPTVLMDIYSTGSGTKLQISGATGASGQNGFTFGSIASYAHSFYFYNGNAAPSGHDGLHIYDSISSVSRMTLNNSGYFGFNITSPLGQVHIKNSSNSIPALIIDSESGINSNILLMTNGTVKAYVGMQAGGEEMFSTSAAGDFCHRVEGVSNAHLWGNGAAEHMRLSYQGYLGIGITTNAYMRFEMTGYMRVRGDITGSNGILFGGSASATDWTVGLHQYVGQLFLNTRNATYSTCLCFAYSNGAAGKGYVGFRTDAAELITGAGASDLCFRSDSGDFYWGRATTKIMKLLGSTTLYNTPAGATRVQLYVDDTNMIGNLTSTRDSKMNITPIAGTERIYDLSVRQFNYRKLDKNRDYADIPDGSVQYGLIFDEVEPIYPELLAYRSDKGDDKVPLTIKYEQLVPILLAEVQKLKAEINLLKS